MDRIERVTAVLENRRPDRPPVSFWRHFPADQVAGPAAVRAHLNHLNAFDLDFLKVMNDNGYPPPYGLRAAGMLRTVHELAAIEELQGNEPEFARQLELLATLRRKLGGHLLMITTVFNAWAVLRQLVRPPTVHRPPNLDAADDEPSARLREFHDQDPAALRHALARIGRSLARFAARCLDAGADGIFLSVRDDWLDHPATAGLPAQPETAGILPAPQLDESATDRPAQPTPLAPAQSAADSAAPPPTYAALVRTTDLQILAAASRARFNMLHVCGRPVDFAAFAAYPVHALNWADRAAGPSITEALKTLETSQARGGSQPHGAPQPRGAAQPRPAICAGVDNLHTLPDGTPADCAREVTDTLRQAGGRPIIIAPGCTYDPDRVPRANLEAVVHAAHALAYATSASP
ncbi:MAG: hypothetical protein AB1716_15220 [Planctomycetota bacterium]